MQESNTTKLGLEMSTALNQSSRNIWFDISLTYNMDPVTGAVPSFVPEIANSWRESDDHHDNWPSSTFRILNDTSNVMTSGIKYSGKYNWLYLDFLVTGGQSCFDIETNGYIPYSHCRNQTDDEYISSFSIYAMVSSPLIVATDIRNMTDIMKKVLLNKEIIDINQENACSIWIRQLNDNMSSYAVILLNLGDDINGHKFGVNFNKINTNWNNDTVVLVRDLWQNMDLGNYTASFYADVPMHGVSFSTMTKQ